ncbi:MAG: hypothetical protein ACM3O3_03615 [Syntrophothermus sp.]
MKKLYFIVFFFSLTLSNIHSQEKYIQESTNFEEKYLQVLNDDIFNYFKLTEYNSELKRKLFLKTTEGKLYADSLKQIKKDLLKKRFFVSFTHTFPAFDVDNKNFTLVLEEAPSNFEAMVSWLNKIRSSIGYLWFEKLPLAVYNGYMASYKELKIKCNEKIAAELEKKEAKVTINFYLAGKTNKILIIIHSLGNTSFMP